MCNGSIPYIGYDSDRKLVSVHRMNIFRFVMYCIYGQLGYPCILKESTDSMIIERVYQVQHLTNNVFGISVYIY